MEQESVKRLSQAIGSNKIEQVKETVRGELRSKIDRLPIDATLQGELLSAVSRLLYPVQPKASLGAITVATGAPAEWLMPVVIFVVITLLILVGKLSILLALCLAAVAVFGFSKWFRKSLDRPAPEPRLLLEGSPEQLSVDIEKVVGMLEDVVDTLQQPRQEQPTKALPLMDCYPNVIRWLQNLYVDSVELEEKQQDRIKRSVQTLLRQCYYEIVDYDGTNLEFFQTDRSSLVDATTQLAPAIVDSRSGKMVVPGSVLFTMDAKI
ncbi:MAG: hypothetical protein IKO85_07555 [Bacteroidaceae bacterium]|nr:hypothetical protein [Bacteroidaceae bacterium]